MRAFLHSFWFTGAICAIGCTQTVDPPTIRSLNASEKTSLLCRDMDTGEGRDMRACPDSEDALKDDYGERHTLALVTQAARGEVAVVDLHEEEVLDQDPSVLGTEHLPVGANPTSIVSTPGGVASFVGVAAPGREAIFALPTTCIAPPKKRKPEDEPPFPAREITLWSSCRLPSAPGEMVIVVDPTENADQNDYRKTCAPTEATDWIAAAEMPIEDRREDCSANLESEQMTGPTGRRKLVVTLPDEGKIAIFDAQAILNLPAGTFDNCVPERVIALSTTVPNEPIEQVIPVDLVPSAGCEAALPRYTTNPSDMTSGSIPAGIALSGSKLYVADLGVPLVHVVELSDPCQAQEVEPLRPLAYDEPGRTVRTRDVAVSDVMPSGKRYVYALDDDDGSAMVFDVSKGSVSNTPVIHERVSELPLEVADRISFLPPISDLALIKHDVPAATSTTDTAEFGVLCDPNPAGKQPGSLYRPDSDYTEGAAPRKLRGLFGMAALTTGQIAAIDVEDWDAPCRRPATNNPNAQTTDWLGCKQVDWSSKTNPFEKSDATLTVTDEASCNVIEPHRLRSGKFFLTSSEFGANATNLEATPNLTGTASEGSASVSVDRDKLLPKMLAVPFEDVKNCESPEATLPYTFVGTTKYFVASASDPGCSNLGESLLETDPAAATQNSILLPMHEPRVYLNEEDFTATYEGVVVAKRENARFASSSAGEILLEDADARFCDQGVQDYTLTYDIAKDLLETSEEKKLATFAKNRGDFAVLMSDFSEDDPYFDSKAVKRSCGETDLRQSCETWFGTSDDPEPLREFTIREAYHDKLVLLPRPNSDSKLNLNSGAVEETLRRMHCCFPGALKYEIRAANQWVVKGSRLLHDIVPGAGSRCVKDCGPRKKHLKNRVFEVSSSAKECAVRLDGAARPECFIGPIVAGALDEVCVVSKASGGVSPSESNLPAGCVFDFLKGRFAIYRGLQPSKRDMAFNWTVKGGFSGLAVSLVNTNTGQNVMPKNMVYSESLDALVVVDGASGGLHLFSLVPFAPLGTPYL